MEKPLVTTDGLIVYVTRKRMKNMYLRVRPSNGRAEVSAPQNTSDAQVLRFVASRREWIAKQQAKVVAVRPVRYVSGESLPYFGKSLTLVVTERAGRTAVVKTGERLALSIRPEADEGVRKRAVETWMRAELIEMAGAMLPGCERAVGKRAGELRVRDMKSRWGSCNVQTADITLNLRLSEKPAECLRYVITHELCHLHEPGHSAEFWRRMDAYYPDWRRVRKLLKG